MAKLASPLAHSTTKGRPTATKPRNTHMSMMNCKRPARVISRPNSRVGVLEATMRCTRGASTLEMAMAKDR